MGAVLTSSSAAYILLPGQYTSSVQPASLQQSLASATSSLTFTKGFSNSTTPTTPTLPLNIALLPGLLNYPSDLYTGDPEFYPLPQSINAIFNSTSINRGSIVLAPNTVAAIEANNNGAKNRVVLWDTVPYISQLPYSMAGNLQVLSIQSTTCSPACSSSAICTTAGTCVCPAGFTGASCESCADGFWGPQCKRECSRPPSNTSFFDIFLFSQRALLVALNVTKELRELVFVSARPSQQARRRLATAQTVFAPARPARVPPAGQPRQAPIAHNATLAQKVSS